MVFSYASSAALNIDWKLEEEKVMLARGGIVGHGLIRGFLGGGKHPLMVLGGFTVHTALEQKAELNVVALWTPDSDFELPTRHTVGTRRK